MSVKAFVNLLFFIFILPVQSFADSDCSTKDLTADMGDLRTQGQTGWCFASAAADLISQRIHRHVSAAVVASDYWIADATQLASSQDPNIRRYMASYPDFMHALEVSREEDGQTHSKTMLKTLQGFEKRTLDISRKGIAGPKGIINGGGDVDKAIILSNVDGVCDENEAPSAEDNVRALMTQAAKIAAQTEDHVKACMSMVNGDSTSALDDRAAAYVVQTYRQLLRSHCTKRQTQALIPQHIGPQSIQEFRELTKSQPEKRPLFQSALITMMDKVLDYNHAVAISYSGYMLVAREADDPDTDGDHASIISGRKKIGNKCFYQIRNSWGDDCEMVEPFKSRCKSGYTWATAEELIQGSLVGLDYIL